MTPHTIALGWLHTLPHLPLPQSLRARSAHLPCRRQWTLRIVWRWEQQSTEGSWRVPSRMALSWQMGLTAGTCMPEPVASAHDPLCAADAMSFGHLHACAGFDLLSSCGLLHDLAYDACSAPCTGMQQLWRSLFTEGNQISKVQ